MSNTAETGVTGLLCTDCGHEYSGMPDRPGRWACPECGCDRFKRAPKAEKGQFPTSWVIDVCRTCGRVATWPFCAHRDNPPADGSPWCAPITVRGSMSPASRRPVLRIATRPAGGEG